MRNDSLQDYYDALDRLINARTKITEKGTKITNDAVSLEAGRNKGSIKKSRPKFADLLAAIDAAAVKQTKPNGDGEDRLNKIKGKVDDLQKQLDAALVREMSLVYELFELRQKLAKLTGEKIFPIRRRVSGNDLIENDHTV